MKQVSAVAFLLLLTACANEAAKLQASQPTRPARGIVVTPHITQRRHIAESVTPAVGGNHEVRIPTIALIGRSQFWLDRVSVVAPEDLRSGLTVRVRSGSGKQYPTQPLTPELEGETLVEFLEVEGPDRIYFCIETSDGAMTTVLAHYLPGGFDLDDDVDVEGSFAVFLPAFGLGTRGRSLLIQQMDVNQDGFVSGIDSGYFREKLGTALAPLGPNPCRR